MLNGRKDAGNEKAISGLFYNIGLNLDLFGRYNGIKQIYR